MSNIPQAVQDAFFTALNVPACTDLAPVRQHLLETAQPPYILIGDVSSEEAGGKGGGLWRMTVQIWTYSRQPNRTQLYAMQAAVSTILDNKPIASSEATLSDPVETKSESSLLSDGQTYFGLQEYELFAQ